ncbi:MAG: hypothetical protein U5L09_05275 [Bacteroidales bacterium]|nr:hypothetical protein [Bacteroidales bacterium]
MILYILISPDSVHIIDMQAQSKIYPPAEVPFQKGKLYRVAPNIQITKEQFYPSAIINYQQADTAEQRYADILRFQVQSGQEERRWNQRLYGIRRTTHIHNHKRKSTLCSYGAKVTELPFALKLE